jgi:hypothetical protein
MRRLLVPVREGFAIDVVERETGPGASPGDLHVFILNVQPKPVTRQTRGLFREAITAHLLERERHTSRPVEQRLAAATVSYHTRVELGEECAEILRCAGEEHRDGILLQADRIGWAQRCHLRLTGWLAEGTAGRVLHSSSLPVTDVHR